MAARSNGGTSMDADGGVAIARPPASRSATRSVRAIGAAASRMVASASSREIVSRIGRMVVMFFRGASPRRTSLHARSRGPLRSPLRSRGSLAGARSHRRESSPQLPDDVPQLWQDELRHGEAHGVFGARQHEDHRAPRDAGAGARKHRRAADLLIAEPAEELAEPIQSFLHKL